MPALFATTRRLGTAAATALGAALALAGCTGSDAPDNGSANAGQGTGASATGGAGGGAASSAGATSGGVSGDPLVLASVARRLSVAELDHVLADVLGDTGSAARVLIEDEFVPYDNDYTTQRASQALIDGLQALAEEVAAATLADPARRKLVVPCTPAAADDSVCFRSVVETLGERLFRRPLSEQEISAYLTLQRFSTDTAAGVSVDFYTAVGLFLRSVLQDPEFLYRIEVGTELGGGVAALDGYEVATRLSFLIAGTTPDPALLAEAKAGSLVEPSGRRAAAERLLALPRSRTQLQRFHSMWLGYRSIPQPPELARAFAAETAALIDRVVFDEKRSYLDLFTVRETYLDAALATHYALPAPGAPRGWVAYADADRAGILSHGSVLSAFSKFSDTSPTQRGILVRARLMCQPVPPPPANVDVDQPPGSQQALCKKDRYAEHRATSSCAACHASIDSIGFGLERYDMAGRFRTHEAELPDCAIEGQGELPGYGAFSGPAELAQKLVDSDLLDACVVRQYLTYAVGRPLESGEQRAVDDSVARFRAGEHDLSSFILDFVSRPEFAQRREPAP